jgi:hypothetical protein
MADRNKDDQIERRQIEAMSIGQMADQQDDHTVCCDGELSDQVVA